MSGTSHHGVTLLTRHYQDIVEYVTHLLWSPTLEGYEDIDIPLYSTTDFFVVEAVKP